MPKTAAVSSTVGRRRRSRAVRIGSGTSGTSGRYVDRLLGEVRSRNRREWRRSPAERRAQGLVSAPVAQPAGLVPPVPGLAGASDGGADRLELALQSAQIGFVGCEVEHLAVLQVV